MYARTHARYASTRETRFAVCLFLVPVDVRTSKGRIDLKINHRSTSPIDNRGCEDLRDLLRKCWVGANQLMQNCLITEDQRYRYSGNFNENLLISRGKVEKMSENIYRETFTFAEV